MSEIGHGLRVPGRSLSMIGNYQANPMNMVSMNQINSNEETVEYKKSLSPFEHHLKTNFEQYQSIEPQNK